MKKYKKEKLELLMYAQDVNMYAESFSALYEEVKKDTSTDLEFGVIGICQEQYVILLLFIQEFGTKSNSFCILLLKTNSCLSSIGFF